MTAGMASIKATISHGFAAMPAVAAATAAACIGYHAGLPPSLRAEAIALPISLQGWFSPQMEADDKPKVPARIIKQSPLERIANVFTIRNIGSVGIRNIALSYAFSFNGYMITLLNHESMALQMEQEGLQAPPPPPVPPLRPPLNLGLYFTGRELAVQTVRRIYEWRAVEALGPSRAEPFLRDHRAWIRDVLSREVRGQPATTRLYRYAFATLHSQVLFYAAECTITVGLHAYNTQRHLKRLSGQQRAVFITKGAALHMLRCFITLLAVSVGAAVGALFDPSYGATVGTLATDYGVTQGCTLIMNQVMLPP